MKDKIVLVTGATDGIGKQVAMELLEREAHVILHGRNEKKMQKAVNELQKIGSGKISTVMGDFTSFASIRKMSEELHEKFERIDVLTIFLQYFSLSKIIHFY